jgi:hypothetical protein
MKRELWFVASAALAGCITDETMAPELDEVEPFEPVPYSFTAVNEQFDAFGRAVAIGDFNGDGFPDLIVGTPGERGTPGSIPYGGVYVYSGSTSTGTLVRDRKLFGSDFGGFTLATVGQFGSALAVGDFDGDGRQDLAVGAPRTTVNGAETAGAVFLYRGTDRGLVPFRVVTQDEAQLDTSEEDDLFGSAVAAGRIASAGQDTLVIGAPGENGMGAVYAIHGPGQGYRGTRLYGTRGGERFGQALAVGDFDGDLRADVVVGAPGHVFSSGRIMVFSGRRPPENPLSWSAMLVHERTLSNPTASQNDGFGTAVAIGNFDTVAGRDIAVGAPGHDGGHDDRGQVRVLSVSSTWTLSTIRTIEGSLDDARLGVAVVNGGRLFDDARDALVIGAPGLGGRVVAFDDATLKFSVTQSSLHSTGVPESADNFGEALAVSKEGRIAIGTPGEGVEDYSTVPPSEVQGAGAVSWGKVVGGSIEDAFLIHQEIDGVF